MPPASLVPSHFSVCSPAANTRSASLRTLRDEVKVDLHLAGMEVRDRWAELEPRIAEAEKQGVLVIEQAKD